jgi:hypothetical protein
VTDLIACQKYMIIAMQRLDKQLAIRTCNNGRCVILADVIVRYYAIALINKDRRDFLCDPLLGNSRRSNRLAGDDVRRYATIEGLCFLCVVSVEGM